MFCMVVLRCFNRRDRPSDDARPRSSGDACTDVRVSLTRKARSGAGRRFSANTVRSRAGCGQKPNGLRESVMRRDWSFREAQYGDRLQTHRFRERQRLSGPLCRHFEAPPRFTTRPATSRDRAVRNAVSEREWESGGCRLEAPRTISMTGEAGPPTFGHDGSASKPSTFQWTDNGGIDHCCG